MKNFNDVFHIFLLLGFLSLVVFVIDYAETDYLKMHEGEFEHEYFDVPMNEQETGVSLVINGIVIAGGNYEDLIVIDNPLAHDVTYMELMEFIRNDKTDEIEYVDYYFVCGDYAEMVHNNAEAQCIKAGFVWVTFDDHRSHIFNMFETVDKGTVYMDCGGNDSLVESFNVGEEIIYSGNFEMTGTISRVDMSW